MRSPTADATAELAAGRALLPPLVLAAYFACIAGAATLTNCALVAALLKRSTNGLYSLIIQLAVADFALVATALGPELWSRNTMNWALGTGSCVAYRGLRVFTSTASLYLVTTIALHTLATVNLEIKAAVQRNKRRERDDDEEIRSSRHSLVANSDTSTPPRTMNVDYRLPDTTVPIAPPSIFVWVLSTSLSIPEFALATTVRTDENTVICTLVDSNHKVKMQSLLAVFNLILPVFIMTIATIIILLRLKSNKLISQMEGSESIAALKLSLSLILVYGVLCAPRSVINVYYIYSTITGKDEQLIHNNNIMILISLVFSAAYLAATLIRPLLCIILIPHLRKIFSLGFKRTDEDNV
ncbi:uncharacterized protein [Epargyreus clarus]|uniref:uncharacterized protein n=1 Tax=Epargyreus clarus TaxID=520877 RepID=UPI003C2BAE6D